MRVASAVRERHNLYPTCERQRDGDSSSASSRQSILRLGTTCEHNYRELCIIIYDNALPPCERVRFESVCPSAGHDECGGGRCRGIGLRAIKRSSYNSYDAYISNNVCTNFASGYYHAARNESRGSLAPPKFTVKPTARPLRPFPLRSCPPRATLTTLLSGDTLSLAELVPATRLRAGGGCPTFNRAIQRPIAAS